LSEFFAICFIFFIICGFVSMVNSIFHKGEQIFSFGEHESKGNWALYYFIAIVCYGIMAILE
tara:strand:- start:133 stop:318 length:186 start_codon:yes stop_codon:yes gene_type:complete